MNLSLKKFNKTIIYSAFTAVFAAVISSLCCIAPLVYLLFGVSSVWLVSLHQLSFLQVPMLIISLLAFVYGGWQLFFSKKISCEGYLTRKWLVILYIMVAMLLLFFLSYPYWLIWLLGDI